MALIRPVVLVYEELASPTATPTNPDLNCLVVGPAYFIQDYFQPGTTTPADKASIQLGAAYGQLEAPIGTVTPTGASVIVVPDAPNDVVGALLDAASVQLWFDEARVIIANGAAGATSSATPNKFTQADASVNFTLGTNRVLPGDRILISDGVNTISRTVFSVDSPTQLHFTQDIPSLGFTPGANQRWRVERKLNDQLVATGPGPYLGISGNQIAINGGITLAVPSQGQKTVSYAKVFIAYRSLRQDLQQLDTVTSEKDITTKIGRLDSRNPLAVGCFVALQNTTTRVQFFGVTSNDLAGHVAVRDAIGSRPDVYAIMPLTADPFVIAMWNADNIGRALPDEVHGRPQRFRAVIGSGTLPLFDTLVLPQMTGQTGPAAGTAPVPALVTRVGAAGVNFVSANVQPGDQLTVTLDAAAPSRNGVYTVAQVLDATHLEIDPSTPLPAAGDATASIQVTAPAGSSRIPTIAVAGLGTAAKGDLFLQLADANGTFVSSGVIPGDLLQFPADPTTEAFAGPLTQFLVAQVLSENRLLIKNSGPDTAAIQNELPRGVERASGTVVPTTPTLNYQVVRRLSKDQQVTHLVAQAQSFSSRRCILVWPDKCDVAGVVNGKSQPGYYLSCAVGGMSAGLPAHQGFTFLGIAGVSLIYDSNTYFNDDQLTELSDGGWYVFAQQTPQSLPFTIHQLTTDVSTLQTGEFSVVKNFDFVALYFLAILEEFLHGYNLTQQALTLIRAALNIGGETLQLRTFAKIGAPLTSFSILALGISPVSEDRAVARLAVGLPVPLNVLELHLAA